MHYRTNFWPGVTSSVIGAHSPHFILLRRPGSMAAAVANGREEPLPYYGEEQEPAPPSSRLCVKNIPKHLKEDRLREHFLASTQKSVEKDEFDSMSDDDLKAISSSSRFRH